MIHRTPPADASVHPSGFVRLPGTDVEISRLPLCDRRHRLASGEPLFARLDYAGALAWCALHGCNLPSAAELEAARVAGLTLRPVTLPIASTLQAADLHDVTVWAQLAAAGWAHGVPVSGAGKHWVRGAPAGRAWLMGWFVPKVEAYGSKTRTGPGWVQPAPAAGSLGAHTDSHVDYSSTTLVVRAVGSSDEPPDTDPAPRLGSSWTDAVTAATLDALRPTAAAVRATVARLLDEGGHVLPPGADSQPGGHVLAPAELAPHGWRCSVAELVADARALGTWREASNGYLPRVGDLAISARAGGDPRRGGTGHVERVVGVDPLRCIGGNEADTWREDGGPGAALVGWIAYPPALGLRCVAIAREELRRGVRERPGPQSEARIQEYHAGARRLGTPRAGLGAHGVSDGVQVLGDRASDEVAWCASSASWCCAQAMRA